MMGFFDFFHQIFSPAVRASACVGLNEIHNDERPDLDPQEPGQVTAPAPSVSETTQVGPPPGVPAIPSSVEMLPQRYGTFLLVDLYPGDLGGKPNWDALEKNSKIGNCEVVGAILKATEGVSYRYTDWFVRNGAKLRQMWQGRLGRDRFMGAYHFLQLARDGAQQAEYFARTIEKVNMPQGGIDIRPAIDFEQGGQYNFFPTDCPKDANGRYELYKLPDKVKREVAKRAMDTTRKCAERFRQITGFAPMLYGRGLQRDLGMTLERGYTQDQLRMGCRGVWDPAYTQRIVPMDAYGWPIDSIPLWQYGGGGDAAHPRLPARVPGFGDVDLNVHIDGPRKTSLDSFRKALVLE